MSLVVTADTQTVDRASQQPIRVAVCDSLPMLIEGLQAVVSRMEGFAPGPVAASSKEAERILKFDSVDLVIIDASFGEEEVLRLSSLARERGTRVVIVGFSISMGGSLRYMSAGARGLLRKDTTRTTVEECLRAVASGQTWTQPRSVTRSSRARTGLASLTIRERQVLALVEQGRKNKSIAAELAIGIGTVKIHVRHIFEKTGLRNRFALRLQSLEDSSPDYVPSGTLESAAQEELRQAGSYYSGITLIQGQASDAGRSLLGAVERETIEAQAGNINGAQSTS